MVRRRLGQAEPPGAVDKERGAAVAQVQPPRVELGERLDEIGGGLALAGDESCDRRDQIQIRQLREGGSDVWHTYQDDQIDSRIALVQGLIYFNNTIAVTHQLTKGNQTGLSGLYSGNAGGYFDNFSLTSPDAAVPEPGSTMLLLGAGLAAVAAVAALRWFTKRT